MTTSRRIAPLPLLLIPWAVQAQGDPADLTGPIVYGLIALEWDVSARNAASISGAARVGETLTMRIPEFADTHGLRHATFTCRWIPDDGAANAGIPDATGTTCSRSDEHGGTSINARVAVLCQGRVASTSRAFCAAPAVLQHRWRVI